MVEITLDRGDALAVASALREAADDFNEAAAGPAPRQWLTDFAERAAKLRKLAAVFEDRAKKRRA